MMGKGGVFYDCLTRVPLIVWDPSGTLKRGVNEDLVELMDAMAAALDIAGVEQPRGSRAQSLASPDYEPRRDVYAEGGLHIQTVKEATPELNLRAGGVLVPFNQLNVLHDGPLRELTDRPLVDRVIVPTTWTEPGVGLYGAARLGHGVSVNYETYLVNGLGPGLSDEKGLRSARRGGLKDNNRNKAWVGRLGLVPTRRLELGVSAYKGKWDDENRLDLSILGADWTYRRGPFKLLGEWARARVDRDAAAVAGGVPPRLTGYYLEASYRRGRWTPVLHLSRVDPDTSQVSRYDVRRLVLGLNYRPSDRTLLKLEWQRNRERADEISNDGVASSVTHYF